MGVGRDESFIFWMRGVLQLTQKDELKLPDRAATLDVIVQRRFSFALEDV